MFRAIVQLAISASAQGTIRRNMVYTIVSIVWNCRQDDFKFAKFLNATYDLTAWYVRLVFLSKMKETSLKWRNVHAFINACQYKKNKNQLYDDTV